VENETQHIIAYLENRLSPEERRIFEELVNNSANMRQEVKEMRFIWETSAELMKRKRIDTARNWNELSRRITIDRFKNRLWTFSRNAAAVLTVPLTIMTIVLFGTIKERDNRPVEQIELTSANGLVTKAMLPDGSEVWLNSGSRLSYPQRFIDNTCRNIYLSGEAYFKIKADKTNSFEVVTNGGLKVCAYGTEFNVCAYDGDSFIETTLVSGNVKVTTSVPDSASDLSSSPSLNGTSSTTVLSKGQQAIFNKNSGSLTTTDVNLAVKTSWKEGKIIFRRANMTEVIRRLSRHFNVDIRLEEKELYDYEYSASFTTETLDEILSLLEKTAPIKCKIIYPEQSEDHTFTKKTVIISMKQK
jgi:ferric-dicitrate binding protein FerR (iron transport regulator)